MAVPSGDLDETARRALGDVARLADINDVLDVCCRVTGMGYTVIAHVTEDRWLACAVQDEIDFGLAVGGELPIQTTLCNDLRNPLAAIDAGAAMLARTATERDQTILTEMRRSVGRMERLIGDVLDFAKGRLDCGMGLTRQAAVELAGPMNPPSKSCPGPTPAAPSRCASTSPGRSPPMPV